MSTIETDVVDLLEEKSKKQSAKKSSAQEPVWEEFSTNRGIVIAKRRYENSDRWYFEYIGYFRDNVSWETLPEKLHSAVEGALGDIVGEGGVTRNNLSKVGRIIKSDINGIPSTTWVFDKLPPFDPDLSRFKITIEIANDEGEQ